jgi:hypothetical protein
LGAFLFLLVTEVRAGEGHECPTSVLDEAGGEISSVTYSQPLSSGAQPTPIGVSESPSYRNHGGYLYTTDRGPGRERFFFGDIAPQGSPDQEITFQDAQYALSISVGYFQPSPSEIETADVVPYEGFSDDEIPWVALVGDGSEGKPDGEIKFTDSQSVLARSLKMLIYRRFSKVKVIVSITDGEDLASMDITMAYDHDIASYKSYQPDPLYPGFCQAVNDQNLQEMRVACISPQVFDGPGDVLQFDFHYYGPVPLKSDFYLLKCEFGDISGDPVPGVNCEYRLE